MSSHVLAVFVLALIVWDWTTTGHPPPELAWVVWLNPHLRIALFVSLALTSADLLRSA
jgi:hypothetical protein